MEDKSASKFYFTELRRNYIEDRKEHASHSQLKVSSHTDAFNFVMLYLQSQNVS
jgi:hypothetical protein